MSKAITRVALEIAHVKFDMLSRKLFLRPVAATGMGIAGVDTRTGTMGEGELSAGGSLEEASMASSN